MFSEQEHEATFFDLGDNTALVCVDHQQYQKVVVPQLIDMTYKVHLGLFEEDVLLKLKTYNYDVVVVSENSDLANLKQVLRRGVTEHRELYNSFNEMLKSVQSL